MALRITKEHSKRYTNNDENGRDCAETNYGETEPKRYDRQYNWRAFRRDMDSGGKPGY